jgi:hypothetical protein
MRNSHSQGGFLALEGSVTRAATQSVLRRVSQTARQRLRAVPSVQRFLAGCELVERSRRPHSSPRATAAALEEAIVAARKHRPRCGLKKLRAFLLRAHPRHRLAVAVAVLRPVSTVPNTRTERVQRALLFLFQTFGLPHAIRSDMARPSLPKPPLASPSSHSNSLPLLSPALARNAAPPNSTAAPTAIPRPRRPFWTLRSAAFTPVRPRGRLGTTHHDLLRSRSWRRPSLRSSRGWALRMGV